MHILIFAIICYIRSIDLPGGLMFSLPFFRSQVGLSFPILVSGLIEGLLFFDFAIEF